MKVRSCGVLHDWHCHYFKMCLVCTTTLQTWHMCTRKFAPFDSKCQDDYIIASMFYHPDMNYFKCDCCRHIILKKAQQNTGLFEMIVRVVTTCHLVLQMQPHVISFCGVTSRIRFMFFLFPQVSRNWRYESELPLKPSPLTCYIQFGMNSIIVLMFVESQRVHI